MTLQKRPLRTEKDSADQRWISWKPMREEDNFTEVVFGYAQEKAVEPMPKRCLECGCHDYFECKLIDFANEYQVKPERFAGDINTGSNMKMIIRSS